MNIKLNSVQAIEAAGLQIGSGTFVKWTHEGYVNATRSDNGKRGGNFTYTLDEIKRIKAAIKQHGHHSLPHSLKEGYVPKEKAPVKKGKMPVVTVTELLTAKPDPTLKAILAELKAIRSVVDELYSMWTPTK